MKNIKIFRKRFIPDELIDMSKDKIVYSDDNVIITKWVPIRKRNDFVAGVSYTFIKEGYKISRFYTENKKLLWWYCDIIDFQYDTINDRYIVCDLLVDVKVFPDGRIEVLDIDEIAEAMTDKIISQEMACDALLKLDKLLKKIYSGNFPEEICLQEEYW